MIQEHLGQPEQGERQAEILDFEKYGAVYGRFLLASQAQTEEEAANFINPDNTTIASNNLTEDSLRERNYNLVAEKSSLNERKKQWEGREFSDAYSQWRTEFTGFMTSIKSDDWSKLSALRIIMSDPKKNAASFTEGDADQLFNEFCKDGSNINNFIERVKTKLIYQNKINPAYLKELLPHLQWIASGLFGKETASNAVTRLIELESALHNGPGRVWNIFNSSIERINTPTDEEISLLNALRKGEIPILIPQEKIIPTQEIKVTVPTVSAEDVSKPAPVPESDEISPPPAEKIPKSEEEGLSNVQPQPAEKPDSSRVKPVIDPELEKLLRDTADPDAENITELGTGDTDIIKELNQELFQSKDVLKRRFSVPATKLKEYIYSIYPGPGQIEGGKIQIGPKKDEITIRDVTGRIKIKGVPVKVTLDLRLTNDLDGLKAKVSKIPLWQKPAEPVINNSLKKINATIKEKLDEQIAAANPNWESGTISISGDKVLIEFGKTPPGKRILFAP